MKNRTYTALMILTAILLTACSSEPNDQKAAQTAEQTPVQENMPRRMGMGGNMMERHHAVIPEPYAGISNPITADEESLNRGAEIYTTHCATCHGDGGMGDGPAGEALDPAPVAIAHTSQMLGDDYQYWRISEGGAMEPFNSGMIAWKTILDEQSRWDVINYVQALGRGQVMPGQSVGGQMFDPAVQAENQAEMLAMGIEQGIISEEEAVVFAAAHEQVDTIMMQMRADGVVGSMDDLMVEIIDGLVASHALSQEQADTFLSVHDRLGEAGLMQ